jgi:pRiA4b ORF-3-like protein
MVAVEDVPARKDGGPSVLCLAEENACPPEDVGGAPGYFEVLAAINNPAHKEHSSMLQRIGGSFDSAAFNTSEANERLSTIKA